METSEILSKLELIEEQARSTLEESPNTITKERQRMIIALVKQLRWHIDEMKPQPIQDPEATVRLSA